MRASYRVGVEWIALNDESGWTSGNDEQDARAIAGFISTQLLADLFGKDAEDVAKAVVRYRRRNT